MLVKRLQTAIAADQESDLDPCPDSEMSKLKGDVAAADHDQPSGKLFQIEEAVTGVTCSAPGKSRGRDVAPVQMMTCRPRSRSSPASTISGATKRPCPVKRSMDLLDRSLSILERSTLCHARSITKRFSSSREVRASLKSSGREEARV